MTQGAVTNGTRKLYDRLQERILARDQVGASHIFYDLVRAERPLTEILHETVKIHAPYTHVPYHQRIDNGFVRFVNNDHCLLSARVSLRMPDYIPAEMQYVPMAQTIWYVPTGLDPWNQLLGNMPGHYARRTWNPAAHSTIPTPEIHWEDQEPLYLDGPFDEKLNHWFTLVQRGEVIQAYRVFLGLFADRAHRREMLSHLIFAGLTDVQDRMLYNRSYTTGHKSYRARATIELGESIGWDKAHDVLYAGVPDMAVGPRWHSAYEMACQISWLFLADDAHKPVSTLEHSPSVVCEERLLDNREPLTPQEAESLTRALTLEDEPAYIDTLTALLLAGKDPKRILDVMQVAAADMLLEVGDPRNFSMNQHCYEYHNTLRWFFENFDHPHRLKLLYVAGSFLNQASMWVKKTSGNGRADTRIPQGASSLSRQELLTRLDKALVEAKPAESVAWTRAYLASGYDRKPLVQTLVIGGLKHGNDTHNQELALCLAEDYLQNTADNRDALLLGSAQHTAGHAKNGDTLEAFRRCTTALGIATN